MLFLRTVPETLAAAGDAVTYPAHGNYRCNVNIRHRAGTGAITVRGSGNACNPARYYVAFHGNVTGVAGSVQLGIYQDGELIPETVMSVFAAATTNVLSVTSFADITADFGDSTISVRTLTPGVIINTAEIVVERRS